MTLTLPKTVRVLDEDYPIRYDFRVIIEMLIMLNDPDLSGEDKTDALFEMFYVEQPPRVKEAVEACFKFIDGDSNREKKKRPKLTDWEQDFEYIIAPVNRVLGYDARGVEYDPVSNVGGLHWWTFMAAFMEIGGDCLYSQIVSIRDKKARKKKLEKYEREFLRQNGDIINFKTHYSDSENDLIEEWTKGAKS